MDLLKEQHLYRSVSNMAPYVTEVVLEFSVNLIKDMFDPHADIMVRHLFMRSSLSSPTPSLTTILVVVTSRRLGSFWTMMRSSIL